MARKSGLLKRLFARIKWPGIGTILLGIYTLVPDNESRIQYWLGAAKTMNGKIGVLAPIIGSPIFGIVLVVAGLSYIALVGEKHVVTRHPVWPILGWIAFGAVALGFSAMLLIGYVVTELHSTGARHLTKEQQISLKRTFGAGPDISTRLWIVSYPECFECRAYAWEFAATLNEIPEWKDHGLGVLPFPIAASGVQLSTLWRGVTVGAIDPQHLTDDQTSVSKALDAAHLPYSFKPMEFTIQNDKDKTNIKAVVLMIAPQEG